MRAEPNSLPSLGYLFLSEKAAAAGAAAAGAVIATSSESFTVTPWAHPHLTQLGCTSRPRFVTVTVVGRPE